MVLDQCNIYIIIKIIWQFGLCEMKLMILASKQIQS